ncbi:unnamed protein product [Absidia cylindrospora]
MDSFTSLPTWTSNTSYYTNSSNTAPSQQLFDLQFASEVSSTNNEQFHQMLQHHQALVLQQQQQAHPQQVMYDQRRDSTSSSGGTNRRAQSKAEKRAEHNAIERARREGLNTRFQQLAHLLPNLQHDTRPSKGTIIERTLEFVKDAIQKEDRYRHEIKDLRHTNRQLLKQLTHLTTGQDANSDAMEDSDDQVSIRSSSPSVFALPNSTPPLPTTSLPLTQASSTSSLSSGASSPPPTTSTAQPLSNTIHQQKPQNSFTLDPNGNNQQLHTTMVTASRKPHQPQPQPQPQQPQPQQPQPQQPQPQQPQPQQQQQQQAPRRQRQAAAPETLTKSTSNQHPSSLRHTPSLSSFSSEVWHQPTSNTFWSQQTSALSHPPVSLFYAANHATTSPTPPIPNFDHTGHFANATMATTETPSIPPTHQHHHYSHPSYIHTASEEDVDMKACDFNSAMIKEDQAYSHQQQPNLFLSQHQHAVIPVNYTHPQGLPHHRLTSRPATTANFQSHPLPQFR